MEKYLSPKSPSCGNEGEDNSKVMESKIEGGIEKKSLVKEKEKEKRNRNRKVT